MNQTKLNPYRRSVSIIGVGCTPFMYTVDKEETNGLTEGELFGYAGPFHSLFTFLCYLILRISEWL